MGQVQYSFFDHYKLGLNYWQGSQATKKRNILGVHGIFGFTEKFYLLSEIDQQAETVINTGVETKSLITYFKLGYEFLKGFHVIFLTDSKQSDILDNKTMLWHYGPGISFFPRPHLELNAVWTKEKNRALSENEGDYAWVLFHYYL